MKLYVAYCYDRHTDPVIRIFSTPGKAMDYARAFMQQNMAHPEHVTEQPSKDHLLLLEYGVEGDHAFVFEAELDGES
jgi:hypothetical protein